MPSTNARLQGLLHVVTHVAEAPEPEHALRELVRALVEELGYRAAIVRLDEQLAGEPGAEPAPARIGLRCIAAWGLSETYLGKGPVEVARSPIDARAFAGETVEIEDVTTDPAFQYGAAARSEGIRGMLALPVRVHGEVRGVLRAYTAEPRRFTDEEREVLAALSCLGGELLERARRHEALTAIMRDLGSTLDEAEVVDRMLRHTVYGLHYSGAALRLVDGDTGELRLAGAQGLSRRYLRAGERRADDPTARRVLTGETVIISDLEREGGLPFLAEALREGIRSVLSVPLAARGRAIGLLRVYSKRQRRFDAYEVRFVRVVAELGALALENARLHALLASDVDELGAETSAGTSSSP